MTLSFDRFIIEDQQPSTDAEWRVLYRTEVNRSVGFTAKRWRNAAFALGNPFFARM